MWQDRGGQCVWQRPGRGPGARGGPAATQHSECPGDTVGPWGVCGARAGAATLALEEKGEAVRRRGGEHDRRTGDRSPLSSEGGERSRPVGSGTWWLWVAVGGS